MEPQKPGPMLKTPMLMEPNLVDHPPMSMRPAWVTDRPPVGAPVGVAPEDPEPVAAPQEATEAPATVMVGTAAFVASPAPDAGDGDVRKSDNANADTPKAAPAKP